MPRRTTWIAKLPVEYAYPDGRREPRIIAIGKPYRHERGHGACAVAADVKTSRAIEIFGNDELQALLLVIQFLAFQLHAFRSSGGRVLAADGHALGLDHYFGPMLRDPKAAPLPKTKRAPRQSRSARSRR